MAFVFHRSLSIIEGSNASLMTSSRAQVASPRYGSNSRTLNRRTVLRYEPFDFTEDGDCHELPRKAEYGNARAYRWCWSGGPTFELRPVFRCPPKPHAPQEPVVAFGRRGREGRSCKINNLRHRFLERLVVPCSLLLAESLHLGHAGLGRRRGLARRFLLHARVLLCR